MSINNFQVSHRDLINIVCSFDNNYAQHCGAMLASLLQNNPQTTFCIYMLLSGTIEPENLEKVKRILSAQGQTYEVFTVNDVEFSGAPISHHISVAAYYRLLIPELLPQHISKVLYLDSDMIVRQPIDDLWNINVEGYSHAAVIAAGMDDYPQQIGLPCDSLYFNSGLMLINLEVWRELDVFKKGCDLIFHQPERIAWWDQDVLNILLQDHWLPLDLTWNAQAFIYEETLNSSYKYKDRYTSFNYIVAKTDPAIVHFVGGGSSKPWHYYCRHPFRDEYIKYLKTTPWKNVRFIGEPDPISKLRFHLGLGSKLRHLFHSIPQKSS